MSSFLVFNRVYRLEIQSVMLVFSDPSCELLLAHLPFSDLSHPFPPSQSKRIVFTDSVWLCVGGG
jgi:hypothetical protein